MTNEEAISIIYEYAGLFPQANEEYKSLDIAIDAIRKQIPKKVTKGHIYWACPSCNKEMPTYRECCDHCGQRLDWSDAE